MTVSPHAITRSLLRLALVTLPLAAQGASPRLVKDIRQTADPEAFGPTDFKQCGGLLYFSAGTAAEGRELWCTDGTVAGTRLVRDINPGIGSSYPEMLVAADGGLLYFLADDGVHGGEWWVTDGSAAGTHLVGDMSPGVDSTLPCEAAALGSKLFFLLPENESGMKVRLCVSEGPQGPVHEVIDQDFDRPERLTAAGDCVFFTTPGGNLWRSDGSAEGTQHLVDYPRNAIILTAFRDSVFFLTWGGPNDSCYLHRSDGTPQGTVELKLIGSFGSYDQVNSLFAHVADDRFYFSGTSGLWRSDGTVAGTGPVKDFTGVAAPGLSKPSALVGDAIFYEGNDRDSRHELWCSQGFAGNVPHLVRDISKKYPWPTILGIWGDHSQAFFTRSENSSRIPEIWSSDGTEKGTVISKPASAASRKGKMLPAAAAMNDEFYYTIGDPDKGVTLWKLTAPANQAKPLALRNFGAPTLGQEGSDPATPPEMVALGDKVFFPAINSKVREIWCSDGSEAGTRQVSRLGIPGSPNRQGWNPKLDKLLVSGDRVYFRASDRHSSTQRGLWWTDAEARKVRKVANLRTFNTYPEYPYAQFVDIGGTVFFNPSSSGAYSILEDLWRVNPSGKPRRVTSADPPLVAAKDVLLFAHQPANSDRQLWRSDGSLAGTYRLSDAYPGRYYGGPYYDGNIPRDPVLGKLGDLTFFFSINSIYVTEGTTGSTRLVATFESNETPTLVRGPLGFVAFDGHAYFLTRGSRGSASDSFGLWKSDGTPEGTSLVKELPLADYGYDPHLTKVGGGFVFLAEPSDEHVGTELFFSDGTSGGTGLLADLHPGLTSSDPRELTSFGSLVYFSANDGVHGRELWQTDGTPAGTKIAADITGDAASSSPGRFTVAGDKLFFFASREGSGLELHVLEKDS